jgi:phage shock protein C
MQLSQQTLFSRHDTFLGICEGLGQDFRFNANYLRLAFALGLLLSPVATLASYVAMGVLILVSRWIFPSHRAEADQPLVQATAAPLKSDNDESAIELAAAA